MPQQADSLQVPPAPHSRHRTKPCPFCAETIRYAAVKCRFCGEFLDGRRPGVPLPGAGPAPDGPAGKQVLGVLWAGRPSVLALTATFLKTACFVALCWLVYKYPASLLLTYVPKAEVKVEQLARIEAWLDLGALGLIVAALFAFAWKLVALKSIRYEVTPDRIEWSRGIFDRRVDNIDMFRVIDLKLRRSILEAVLGIGTVILLTKDETDPRFEFRKVHHCRYLYDTLKQAGLDADRKRGVIHLE